MQGYALGVMLWPQIGQYFSLTSARRAQEGQARFDGSDSPSINPQCLHFSAPAMIGSRQNGQGMCGFVAAPSRASAGIAAARIMPTSGDKISDKRKYRPAPRFLEDAIAAATKENTTHPKMISTPMPFGQLSLFGQYDSMPEAR